MRPWPCLALAALLAAAVCATAAPLERWSVEAFPAAERLVAGGPGNRTLVALRPNLDPLGSLDGGHTWSEFTVSGARPLDVSISPADGSTWYAVTQGDGSPNTLPRVILRTRDGGTTWEERSRMTGYGPTAPSFGPDPDSLFLARYDPPSCGFVCTPSAATVLVSRDGGTTWSDPNPGMKVLRLYASPADSRVAYATTFDAPDGNVLRTADGGMTWARVDLPPSTSLRHLYLAEIALDAVDAGTAYVRPERVTVPARDLYVTRDGGLTWSTREAAPGALVPDPAAAGRLYVYTDDGRTFESRDAGAAWALVDTGIPATGQASGRPTTFHVVREGATQAAVGVASAGSQLARLDLTNGALALGSDLWWNAARPGVGLTITQHASNGVFVVWYTYDASGNQAWRVIPGGTWSDRTFAGTVYETTGPAYFQGAFDPSAVQARAIGTARIEFADEGHAEFTFTDAAGIPTTQPISRQAFGDPARATTEDFADLWFNASEPGWGIGISHQGDRVFATWYVYGEDGKPAWIVMPDAVLRSEFVGAVVRPVASGDIYVTRGPAEGAPYDPAQVVPTLVGTARLVFRGANGADLEYTAFGRSDTRAITRQPF